MFLFTKIFPLFVQISNWYGGDKETADYRLAERKINGSQDLHFSEVEETLEDTMWKLSQRIFLQITVKSEPGSTETVSISNSITDSQNLKKAI